MYCKSRNVFDSTSFMKEFYSSASHFYVKIFLRHTETVTVAPFEICQNMMTFALIQLSV